GARILFCLGPLYLDHRLLTAIPHHPGLVCRSPPDDAALPAVVTSNARRRSFVHNTGDQVTACAEYAVSRFKPVKIRRKYGCARWLPLWPTGARTAKACSSAIPAHRDWRWPCAGSASLI